MNRRLTSPALHGGDDEDESSNGAAAAAAAALASQDRNAARISPIPFDRTASVASSSSALGSGVAASSKAWENYARQFAAHTTTSEPVAADGSGAPLIPPQQHQKQQQQRRKSASATSRQPQPNSRSTTPRWEQDEAYFADNYARFDVPHDRQYEDAYRRQLQLAARKREQDALRETLELEECTFQPNINHRPRSSSSGVSSASSHGALRRGSADVSELPRRVDRRPVFDRLAKPPPTAFQKLEMLKKEQEERELAECFFTPEINRNYEQKLQEWVGNTTATERLYGHALHLQHLEQQRRAREVAENERESASRVRSQSTTSATLSPNGSGGGGGGGRASLPRCAREYQQDLRRREALVQELKEQALETERAMLQQARAHSPPHRAASDRADSTGGGAPPFPVRLTAADEARRAFNEERLRRLTDAQRGIPQQEFAAAHRQYNEALLQGSNSGSRSAKMAGKAAADFLARQQADVEARSARSEHAQSQMVSRSCSATPRPAGVGSGGRAAVDEAAVEKKRKGLTAPIACHDPQYVERVRSEEEAHSRQAALELAAQLKRNRESFEMIKAMRATDGGDLEKHNKKNKATLRPPPKTKREKEEEAAAIARQKAAVVAKQRDRKATSTSPPREYRVPLHSNTPTSKSAVRARRAEREGRSRSRSITPPPELGAATRPQHIDPGPVTSARSNQSEVSLSHAHDIDDILHCTHHPMINKKIAVGRVASIREVEKKVYVKGEHWYQQRVALAKQRQIEAEEKLRVKPSAVRRVPYVNAQGWKSMVTEVAPFEQLERHLVESEMHRHKVEAELQREFHDVCQFHPTTNAQRYFDSLSSIHQASTNDNSEAGGGGSQIGARRGLMAPPPPLVAPSTHDDPPSPRRSRESNSPNNAAEDGRDTRDGSDSPRVIAPSQHSSLPWRAAVPNPLISPAVSVGSPGFEGAIGTGGCLPLVDY